MFNRIEFSSGVSLRIILILCVIGMAGHIIFEGLTINTLENGVDEFSMIVHNLDMLEHGEDLFVVPNFKYDSAEEFFDRLFIMDNLIGTSLTLSPQLPPPNC